MAEPTEEELKAQDEAEFLAATKGEEPPKDELAGEVPEGDTLPEEDEFAGIPPSLIEKLEAKLAGSIEQKLSGRLRNIEGHIGGLKHNLTQLSTAAKAAESQGAQTPNASQIREAAAGGEKLAALKEEFPEWAEALEESMAAVRQQTPQVNMDAINQRIQSTEESVQAIAHRARQLARLDIAHPDWEQTIQTDQYQNWLHNQPQETQALINSESAADAMKVLNAYKDYRDSMASKPNLAAQDRQRRLEAAITPTAGGQTTRRAPKTEHEEFLEAFGR